MIDLSIHNFRGLSRTRLVDDSPLSVVTGPNQSGKTSLAQAVGFAFCGTVGEISDPKLLVHHGQADLRVCLNLPGWTIERSLARGPKVSDIAARLGNISIKALHLLFNSSASLNCSAHLSAFLNSLENEPGDYAELLRGDPEAHSLFSQALHMRQGKLRSCLFLAKEQRERMAPRFCPPEPRERQPGPDQLEFARAQLEAAADAHKLAIEASAVLSVQRARLAAASEWYVAQERFAQARNGAGPDRLGEGRTALEGLSEVETGWLERTGQLLLAAGQQDLSAQIALVRSQVEAARVQAAQTLSFHTLEPIPEAPLPLPEETQTELCRLGVACEQSLEGAAKKMAADAGRADQAVAETRVALSEAQSIMIKLERARAVWKQYETVLAEYEESEVARGRQYDAWNRVAQAVQSHLDQTAGCARGVILSLVNGFARRLLGVEEVSIDPHGRLLT